MGITMSSTLDPKQLESLLPPTGSCPLLRILPTELRQKIWWLVLDSTTVAYCKKHGSSSEERAISLALLRVCREISNDIGTSWLGRVLFYFESSLTMLEVLSPRSRSPELLSHDPSESQRRGPTNEIVSQIRRIRVYGMPFSVWWSRDYWPADIVFYEDDPVPRNYYGLIDALRLIPCLQLDTLLVEGNPDGRKILDDIKPLLRYGNGWRELRWFTSNSALGHFRSEYRHPGIFTSNSAHGQLRSETRHPGIYLDHVNDTDMPVWRRELLERDGAESGSSITLYRTTESSTLADPPYRVTWPQDSEMLFEQETPSGEGDGIIHPKSGAKPRRKGFMIVVKRGPAASMEERDPSPLEVDIRKDGGGATWEEIARKCYDYGEVVYCDHDDAEIEGFYQMNWRKSRVLKR